MERQQGSFQLASPVHLHSLADKAARESLGAVCLHWVTLDLMVERLLANLNGESSTVRCSNRLCQRLEELRDAASRHGLEPEERSRVEDIALELLALHEEWERLLSEAWSMDPGCVLTPLARGYHKQKGVKAECARRLKANLWRNYRQLQQIALRKVERGGRYFEKEQYTAVPT